MSARSNQKQYNADYYRTHKLKSNAELEAAIGYIKKHQGDLL